MALVHDIWLGDSRVLAKRFQAKRRIRSVITDPPFGVDNLSRQAETPEGRKYARKIANDETPEQAMAIFDQVMEQVIPGMMDESDIYIFTSYVVLAEWIVFADRLLAPHGYERKSILIWEKDGPGMGDLNSWGIGCEFILYYKRGQRVPRVARRNNVFHIPQVRPVDLIHPHEKPVPLLELFVNYSTNPGEFVLDPFGGSGSLVRACQRAGRSGVAIELDEENHALAMKKLRGSEGGGFDFD